MAAVYIGTKSREATQDHTPGSHMRYACSDVPDYSGYFGNEWQEDASSCRGEAARRSLCTYQGAWMKSGELQTRSRAEYIAEIEDQSTTVRITEVGPQLRG
jgi:hypothetical protein